MSGVFLLNQHEQLHHHLNSSYVCRPWWDIWKKINFTIMLLPLFSIFCDDVISLDAVRSVNISLNVINAGSHKYINRSSHPGMFLEKVIVKICSIFTGEHPCRSVISGKLLCNFIEITLWHGCSPVNLLYIFRTAFTKNTSGRLPRYQQFY